MLENLDALKNKIVSYKPDNPDRIAILIKTINRTHLLLPTLESIFEYCDVAFRLYLGDDGSIDCTQREIYELLQKAGHFVRIYDQPIAFTAALNDLCGATRGEKFILRIDDDFGFCEETRVSVLRRILELVPSLGVIAGAERQFKLAKGKKGNLRSKQAFLISVGDTMYRVNVAASDLNYTTIGGHRFAVVNYTTNFLLIRKTVLRDVAWNQDLWARGEHLDFSLRLAKAGWLIGFTPDCIHEHREDGISTSDYTGRSIEPDRLMRDQLLAREHGIQSVRRVDFHTLVEKLDRQKSGWLYTLQAKLLAAPRRWLRLLSNSWNGTTGRRLNVH